jgi:hypothetical protein
MTRRLHILGRAIPVWLLILTLVVAGAGAAVGTVLAGQIGGEMPVTVSQALVVKAVDIPDANVDEDFTSLSDDGTGFTAAAEVDTGMDYTIDLALGNNGDEALVGKLTLILPDGITVSLAEADGVTNLTRTGLYTWMFDLAASETDTTTDITITVAVADDLDPGFYPIEGTIEQVAY